MSLFRTFMQGYQYLFHPGVVIAAALLLLVYRDCSADHTGVRSFAARVGLLLGIQLAAVVPVGLYLLVREPSVTQLTAGTDWRINLVTAVSLLVGGAFVWYVWSTKPWDKTVSSAGAVIVATAILYALVAPVWNVSGHVTFTLVPTLYLALVDWRYWPLLAIPLLMVVNRPVLGAHTWLQSIAGLVLGVVGVLAVYR